MFRRSTSTLLGFVERRVRSEVEAEETYLGEKGEEKKKSTATLNQYFHTAVATEQGVGFAELHVSTGTLRLLSVVVCQDSALRLLTSRASDAFAQCVVCQCKTQFKSKHAGTASVMYACKSC